MPLPTNVSPVAQVIDQFCADFDIDVSLSDVIGENATYHIHFVEKEVAVLIHEPTGDEYWYDEQNDGTWALTRVEGAVLHRLTLL